MLFVYKIFNESLKYVGKNELKKTYLGVIERGMDL